MKYEFKEFEHDNWKKMVMPELGLKNRCLIHGKAFSGIYQIRDEGNFYQKYPLIQGLPFGAYIHEDLSRNGHFTFGHSTFGAINGPSIIAKSNYILSAGWWDNGTEVVTTNIEEVGTISYELDIRLTHDDLNLDATIGKCRALLKDKIDEWESWKMPFEELPIRFYELEKKRQAQKLVWAIKRKENMEKGLYKPDNDLLPYYFLQNELREKVITTDDLPEVKFIAGVDVAYNELTLKMVGGIVVLDANTFELVDKAYCEMDVTFPYFPGLFSFREVPPIIEAYKKLRVKPDLVICDGHGIAHPRGVGIASHLGLDLNLPTIGCAKSRLIGEYEPLGNQRGNSQPLVFADKEVGKVLRTQDNVKPVFVSIGHRISLATACDWVLRLSSKYRLPETTRLADSLVNVIIKNRTEFKFPE